MLTSIDKWITRFENAVLATGTALAVLLAALQVILRYCAGISIYWAEELVVYSIIWTAFISASAALRTREHLSVELINVFVRGRSERFVASLASLLEMAAGIAFFILGIQFVLATRMFGQLSPAMQMPMWIVYLVVPLSGALIIIRSLQNLMMPTPEIFPDLRPV